jgi:protein-S-isoprenylcysteine O-methyltransferase Ste14
MWMLLRQLCAIVALPGVVAIMVPVWIARRNGVELTASGDFASAALQGLGIVLLTIGVGLFSASLYYFWSRGRGTLAPWDPPRRVVVDGPYRFVRNPMISGVLFILFGEALVLRSPPHALWAGVFLMVNVVYIPLLEEPMLGARFGEPYRRYKRHVPRFVPRIRPWSPDITSERTDHADESVSEL